ncbi:MAG: thiamine pyrophosphate-binding protein [Actinomycetota bacterium]
MTRPPDPADTIAAAVAATGCSVAFGVPGGGPNLDLVGALDYHGVRFVLAHSEAASCIMASAYGHLTGSVSAAVVTRGPGATAAVNGVAQATLDRHPLLVVTDTVPHAQRARIAHQRLDQRALMRPITKASWRVGSTEADVDGLLAIAAAEPPGAVHIDYDGAAITVAYEPEVPIVAPPPVTQEALGHVARYVAHSQRPIVIVGRGGLASGSALQAELEAFGAPVLVTYQASGTIPSEHPLCGGHFTNGAAERPLIDEADLIVLVGFDPVEPIPAEWPTEVPVVSLAATRTTDAYAPITAELVGDPATLLAQLLATGAVRHTWSAGVGAFHRRRLRQRLSEGEAEFGPVELVTTAARHTPTHAITTVDAGAHFLAIMPFWPIRNPGQLLISNGLATMGYAVPAAIGAALARPGTPVVALVGDGGLAMTQAELETIARLDLPITIVVFNDGALSLIEIKQRPGQGGNAAVRYGDTDFAAIADAHGVAGTVAHSIADVEKVLTERRDRPRLIDARIDPAPYPHLMQVTRG